MSDKSFSLRAFDLLYNSTAVVDDGGCIVRQIEPDKLLPFKNHPFRLYSGKRMDDLITSIRERGILVPILARPMGDAFEILSGHNRVEAGKAVMLATVPFVIMDGLSDDEALLIVTETNLLQRSFMDLAHSERAAVLAVHHDAIKHQGRRTDLINEVENILCSYGDNGSTSFSQVAKRLHTHQTIADQYSLSKDTIARYLRINRLTPALKELVDNGDIALLSGVALSYLSEQEQQTVHTVLLSGDFTLDMKKADALRDLSANGKLTEKTALAVLAGAPPKNKPPPSFKLRPKIIRRYFKPEQKQEEIETIIICALDNYFGGDFIDDS